MRPLSDTPIDASYLLVNGLWSMTMHNEHQFLQSKTTSGCSLDTKNESVKRNADGSLMIEAQVNIYL